MTAAARTKLQVRTTLLHDKMLVELKDVPPFSNHGEYV
jgi:hypothetical protein